MDLGGIGLGRCDWIVFVQGRKEWRALVNTILNLLVLYNSGKFSNSCTATAFEEGLRSMELVTFI
jgi:hypothetical protein